MNTDINKTARCYIGYYENNPVVFAAILSFPHAHVKNFRKLHRLVVLPDYQGLGIGNKFTTFIAKEYQKRGYRFIITASTKALFHYMKRAKDWIITRKGRVSEGSESGQLHNPNEKFSRNKLTYSYEYIGEK